MDIQTKRKIKLDRQETLLKIYKTQLNQLSLLVKQREKSVQHLKEAMEIEDLKRSTQYKRETDRAQAKALSSRLAIGDRYLSEEGTFEVRHIRGEIIGVVNLSSGAILVASKSLDMLSEVFYYDQPNAMLISCTQD